MNRYTSYYNTVRPHLSLGPAIPSLPETLPVAVRSHRYRLPEKLLPFACPVLRGLHHDYRLAAVAD